MENDNKEVNVKKIKIYWFIVCVLCSLYIISNICATKLIVVGPLIFDGGAILFPFTYIFGDVLAEIFGFKKTRKAVIISFSLQLLACSLFLIVQVLPAEPSWENQKAFEAILGFVPRIVLASLLGYICGQLSNAFVLQIIKKWTGEKHLWARLIGSTIVGEFLDSLVFCVVAWIGEIGMMELANYTITGFIYKTSVEIIFVPVTYRVIKKIKKTIEVPN